MLRAILRAIATAYWREQRSLGSFASNNFFVAIVIFLRKAGALLLLVMALLMLFPLSADPLRKAPAVRLALWPLSRAQRVLLRFASVWINPMSWLIVAALLWASPGMAALVFGLAACGYLVKSGPAIRVPAPPGRFGVLAAKDLRQMLTSLDLWCALALSLLVLGFRIAGQAPYEALLPMSVLIVLALSGYAQGLFAFDGPSGLTRYRLLGLRGWQVLALKDASFAAVAALLTLPADPLAGTATALAALAVGHSASVHHLREQPRWRFSPGAGIPNGLLQLALIIAAVNVGPLAMLPVCGVSTAWYGRALNQTASAA
jgi:hypothetical protein